MVKNKRRLSPAQQDKQVIAAAKALKKKGILSKQTKLHGGKFVSRAVLKKVRELEFAYRADYTSVKVPREIARKAKEQGLTVVGGNRVVTPSDRKFINRLKAGNVSGVRPVRGGVIETVVLPHSIFDIRSLVAKMREPGGLDNLKLEDEQFAFKYFGNMSYAAFSNTQQLLEYLLNYRSIFDAAEVERAENLQEEFENLSLLRFNRVDVSLAIPSKDKRKARTYTVQDRRGKPSYGAKLAKGNQNKYYRFLDKERERSYNKRIAMTEEQKAAYKAAGKERARRSYEARKNKDKS